MTRAKPVPRCPGCHRRDGGHNAGCPYRGRYYVEIGIAVFLLAMIALLLVVAVTGYNV